MPTTIEELPEAEVMPSPFPGMNPYFEQADHWRDFHLEFLVALRRQLVSRIAPGYYVQLEENIYLEEYPIDPDRTLVRPDISLTESGIPTAGPGRIGVLEASTLVQIPTEDFDRLAFLQVRDRHGREVITVIELLSPTNKRPGAGRLQYLAKRRKILQSTAHLVEIDLLRGWNPMPADDRPGGDYSVLLSRVERRPAAEVWPVRLRDRLPVIPIPLKPTDPDGRVDLQEVLHQAYDGPGYGSYIYDEPPEPPLRPADSAWATQFVPKRP